MLLLHVPPPTAIHTLSLHDALPIYLKGLTLRKEGFGETTSPQTSFSPPGPGAARARWRKGWFLEGCKPSKPRSEEHTSELQSRRDLVCRLLLEKKKLQDVFCAVPCR